MRCLKVKYVSTEIKEAKFLSVMSDDATNVPENTHTFIVFHYELQDTVHERFW